MTTALLTRISQEDHALRKENNKKTNIAVVNSHMPEKMELCIKDM